MAETPEKFRKLFRLYDLKESPTIGPHVICKDYGEMNSVIEACNLNQIVYLKRSLGHNHHRISIANWAKLQPQQKK